MPNLYDKMLNLDIAPIKEQIADLLQRTWAKISIDYCRSILERKYEQVNESDIARVELSPDEVRCAVYSNINRWDRTSYQHVLDEWLDLTIDEQNSLLIEAFPGDKVYGV